MNLSDGVGEAGAARLALQVGRDDKSGNLETSRGGTGKEMDSALGPPGRSTVRPATTPDP